MSFFPMTVEHPNFPVMGGAVLGGSVALLIAGPPSKMTYGDLLLITLSTVGGALVGTQVQKYRERHAPPQP